tara:strand:+ start:495 stop:896 length:402 start_codon:yes stop_codon:yes gene_type:complete
MNKNTKNILITVLAVETYLKLKLLIAIDFKVDDYLHTMFLFSFFLISSILFYLYKQNKITNFYLMFACLINFLQITNEIAHIPNNYGDLIHIGTKSFIFYFLELFFFISIYLLVIKFCLRKYTSSLFFRKTVL